MGSRECAGGADDFVMGPRAISAPRWCVSVLLFLLCCTFAFAACMPTCQGHTVCADQAITWPAMVGITPRGAPRLFAGGAAT